MTGVSCYADSDLHQNGSAACFRSCAQIVDRVFYVTWGSFSRSHSGYALTGRVSSLVRAAEDTMQQRRGPDTLDKTVTYLAKRDGIDKASEISPPPVPSVRASCRKFIMNTETYHVQVLKVIRYSTKLALATALKNDSSDLAQRLKEFEGSIGTSRYALKPLSGLHSKIIGFYHALVLPAERPIAWVSGCLMSTLCVTLPF